jgi:hypothetical protein
MEHWNQFTFRTFQVKTFNLKLKSGNIVYENSSLKKLIRLLVADTKLFQI